MMDLVPLGSTGLLVSRIAFGAGPVSGLMTADAQAVADSAARQRAVVQRAIELGINWFDTAATYGEGRSEQSLGHALAELGAAEQVNLATKVRLRAEDLDSIEAAVRESVQGSLARLQVGSVTLLQLHNSVTWNRGDEPTSITPADVLGPGGVLEAFRALRAEGIVRHLGFTGLGTPDALRELIRTGEFATVQLPYQALNPSAGRRMKPGFSETDHGNIIADCAEQGMAVFPIRVFAGGAIAARPPSAHTYKTPFFPLALYERDVQRAATLRSRLADVMPIEEYAVRFALSHPQVTAAIIGLGTPDEVEAAARFAAAGPLPQGLLDLVDDPAP